MSAIAPAQSYSYPPQFHIKVVMDKQKIFDSDTHLFHEGKDWPAGEVHIGDRFRENQVFGKANPATGQLFAEGYVEDPGKSFYYKVSDIMSRP